MMCHQTISSRTGLLPTVSGLLAVSVVAMSLLSSRPAAAQTRYPTFGLPSSAYGVPAVKVPTRRDGSVPQSLSPSQTNGARPLPGRRSRGLIRPVAHTQSGPQPSEVQRELQKLYEQDGREMPEMDMPRSFQQPPVRPTSTTNTAYKRSVVDLMKREDTRFNTVQPQSSVRPAPTAQPQQGPPRNEAAVGPTDGRRKSGGLLSGLFNWGQRPTRTVAPNRPPVEPQPYRPPTYKSQPQVRKLTPQPPQQQTAKVRKPKQRRATNTKPRQPATSTTQTAQRPATTPKPQATPPAARSANSFELIPLTEPVLAPPSEDELFPSDIAESTPQPQPQVTAPQTEVVQSQTPQVVPEPRNYAKELGIVTKVEAPVAEVVTEPAQAPLSSTLSLDQIDLGNPFPDDDVETTSPSPATIAAQPEVDDNELFQLPRTSPGTLPEAGRQAAVAIESQPAQVSTPTAVEKAPVSPPEPSPFTGRKLAEGAFQQPKELSDGLGGSQESKVLEQPKLLDDVAEEPNKLIVTTPLSASHLKEPGHFFPTDEHAIEPEENMEIDTESMTGSAFAPSGTDNVATADSRPSIGASLKGSRMQQIAARDGVGLKGYCPVALRDDRTLNDGKAAYISFYHAKAYYFATAEAKAAFDNDPQKYAPASNGNDVTLMAVTGEVLEGSLDHAVWYKDQLYLFSSDENLKTFMAAPSAMAATE